MGFDYASRDTYCDSRPSPWAHTVVAELIFAPGSVTDSETWLSRAHNHAKIRQLGAPGAWLEARAPVALQLQRPLPDDALVIVARGAKQDPAAPM
jgi:hypothetical protein